MDNPNVSIQTANCTINANEIQFDVQVVNNGTKDIQFNSTVVRMLIAAGLIPAGTVQGDIVFSYVGNSDFPNSFPPKYNNAYTFTLSSRQASTSTGTAIYTNTNCGAPNIAAGATATIGRFSIKHTKQNWVAGQDSGLAFHPTVALIGYIACAPVTTGFNTATNRIIVPACSLQS